MDGADAVYPFKTDDSVTYYTGEVYFGNVDRYSFKEINLPFTPESVAVEFERSVEWGRWNTSGYVTNSKDYASEIRYVKTLLNENSIIISNVDNYVGFVKFTVFDKPIFN